MSAPVFDKWFNKKYDGIFNSIAFLFYNLEGKLLTFDSLSLFDYSRFLFRKITLIVIGVETGKGEAHRKIICMFWYYLSQYLLKSR